MTATTYITTTGTVYEIVKGEHGLMAYPAKHPEPPKFWRDETDWGPWEAAACGLLVESHLDGGNIAVQRAGREWLEVYHALQRAEG